MEVLKWRRKRKQQKRKRRKRNRQRRKKPRRKQREKSKTIVNFLIDKAVIAKALTAFLHFIS
jgi:hypothetical protein